MDNELYDTFGDEYKTLTARVEQLEKVTDGDLIVMPDGTTYTMQDLGLTDVSVRVFYQSDAPTGLNSSTHVGDVWIDSDDNSAWFWDGISWVSKGTGDSYSGGTGLEALGPGVVARLLTSIDITSSGSAPAGPTWGDIWRNTSAGNAISRWNGSSWVSITDNNIVVAVDKALTDPIADVSDGGIRVFYQTVAPGGLNTTTHKGDLWYDTDESYKAYKWNGSAWQAAVGQGEQQGETDGLPPGFSPTPDVGSGIGSLFITWDSVPNADPVWYFLYISTTANVQLIGANYLGQFWGEVAVVQELPDGSALLPNTTYYVKLVAMDADGAAPPSAEASGQIMLIDINQFAADVKADIENIDTIQATADGKNTNYYQDNAPSGTNHKINDQWFETDNGYKPHRWNGSTWAPATFGTAAITTGSITSSLISAGAITADKLSVNSITADALTIGSSTANKVLNSSFESDGNGSGTPDGWAVSQGSGSWSRSSAQARDGSYSLLITGNNMGICSRAFPLTLGETIGIEFYVRSDVASGTFIAYLNTMGAEPVGGYVTAAQRSSWSTLTSTTLPGTTWTKYTATYTASGAQVGWGSIEFYKSATTNMYVDSVRIDGQASSVMIANGAIVSDKIGANSIIAGKIATNAVTAGTIAANAVTAGSIAAESISSGHIQAGQIIATHIQANAITAGKIAANAIDGMTITGAWIRTSSVYPYGVQMTADYLAAFDSAGNTKFVLWGNTGNMETYGGRYYGGLFMTSNGSQRIEMGDTGWGDPVDEIRMFNNGAVTSIRHLSGWAGYIYFNCWGEQMSMHYTNDGHISLQRGTGGLQLKWVHGELQVYNGSNSGYSVIAASQFRNASSPDYKRGIVSAEEAGLPAAPKTAPSCAAVLKKAGLKKYFWTDDFLGIPQAEARSAESFAADDPEVNDSTPEDERERKGRAIKEKILSDLYARRNSPRYGLIKTELPEWLQDGDGYNIDSALAFLWEALKEANLRIDELEQGKK